MEPQNGNGGNPEGKTPFYQPRVIALAATRQGIPAVLVWSMALVAAVYAMIGMLTS